jgi:hypothetical protein
MYPPGLSACPLLDWIEAVRNELSLTLRPVAGIGKIEVLKQANPHRTR